MPFCARRRDEHIFKYLCHCVMTEKTSNKQHKARNPEAEMSFWEHLEELRWHLVRSALAILIMAVAAFLNRHLIFDGIILAPNQPEFFTNRVFCKIGEMLGLPGMCFEAVKLKIINYSMSGQFMTHMKISFIAGLVLATPYVVWEIWRFLAPALKETEKKYSRGAVLVISALFLLGVLFGYYVIVPLTIQFFGSYQVSEAVNNQIALSSFISTVVSGTLATGLIFELPVFTFFLTRTGILSTRFLKKSRKYTLVIILVLSAIITPPDIFSQILVGIPLYGLFEFSIWISSKAERKISPAG